MRFSTAVHPTEYCRSTPPLNAFPRIPVALGLSCSPEGEVDFFEGRGLDRVAVAELATCGFVGRGENEVLQGLTGTGKVMSRKLV